MGKLLLVALVLSVNNFGVALAMGGLGMRQRRFRIGMVFGAFEFLMPLVGLLAGRAAAEWLLPVSSWLAPLLIAAFGVWALGSALRDRNEDSGRLRQRTGSTRALIFLALGLSLDNLAIGFGLGTRGFEPLSTAVVIAVTVFLFIQLGLALGHAARRQWHRRASVASGVLLLGLAGAMIAGWI